MQVLPGCRRMDPWLLLPRILLFLDTLRPRVIDGSEGVAAFGLGFCCTRSSLSSWKLHWSPFTGNRYLFLLQRRLVPFRFVTTALGFNSPVPRVTVSQSKFVIYASLHHCLQFLIVGHRYLLMNLDVVQFQYGFALRRPTYLECVQTFQDIIDGIFDMDSRTSSHLVSNS